jgi:hypothetical protein
MIFIALYWYVFVGHTLLCVHSICASSSHPFSNPKNKLFTKKKGITSPLIRGEFRHTYNNFTCGSSVNGSCSSVFRRLQRRSVTTWQKHLDQIRKNKDLKLKDDEVEDVDEKQYAYLYRRKRNDDGPVLIPWELFEVLLEIRDEAKLKRDRDTSSAINRTLFRFGIKLKDKPILVRSG